jgi:hypothetical protein
MSTLHQFDRSALRVGTPKSQDLSLDSRSDGYLRATRLVSELHQRGSFDIPSLLREVIEGAAESVPGAQYAGVTVTQRRRLCETAAATQQGPALTAGALQESVRIDDLVADDRWPIYRQEALKRAPIRSILSVGMFREGSTAATLNFYAEPANAFDDGSADLGLIFATHTALVWNMMRRDQQFRAALVSRDVIGQAKGRMMERFNIDADQAFAMLKLMSQESNTPIAQVAQRLLAGKVRPSPQ